MSTPATPPATPPPAPAAPAPGSAPPAAAAPIVVGAPAAPVPAAPAAIVIGTRTFKDQAELLAYTTDLEARARPAQAPAPATRPAPGVELIDGKPIDEVMFNDPIRYHNYVMEKAREAAMGASSQVNQQAANEKNFWDTFYQQNPDLKSLERIVQSEFNRDWATLSKLNVPEAQTALALAARKTVDLVKQASGIVVTPMAHAGAGGLPVGGSAPVVPVTEAPVLNFVEQVAAFRRKQSGAK